MKKTLRNDLQIISSLIKENEKVLDVGCGNGSLIEYLSKEKNVDCKGIEIELEKMSFCLKKGLSVVQGDANYDLNDFSDNSFSNCNPIVVVSNYCLHPSRTRTSLSSEPQKFRRSAILADTPPVLFVEPITPEQ